MRERRIPLVDDAHAALGAASPQLVHRIGARHADGDGREVHAFGQRVVDRVGPADDRDDLVVFEERERRRETVRGAVGVEQPFRVACRGDRIGRGEDARAHPPQCTVRGMMREDAAARHDQARGLGRERRERVRGFPCERVVGDGPAGHGAQPLGRRHVTPHGDSDVRHAYGRGYR